MRFKEKKFRLEGTMPLLGSTALDKEIYSKYIATKAKNYEEADRAKADAEDVEGSSTEFSDKITGFYKEDGCIVLKGYQVKGFLKSAAKSLRDQLGITSYLSKIDNYVFVMERNIPVFNQETGERITTPDGFLERPLRGQTAQGERIALAKSEMIKSPWYIDVTIRVLDNKSTAKSIAVDMDFVRDLLSYGELKGLLQWRNAGYGSFTFKELS